MRAPIRQQIRCFSQGHDWRLAIDPEGGFYHRCRRCWRTDDAPAEVLETRKPPANPHIARG